MSDGQRPPWWLGLLMVAAGAFVIGTSIWADEAGFHAPRWVVGAAGAAFLLAGLSMFVQGQRLLAGLLLALMMTAFAATFMWVSFGPGERQFSSTVSIPFLSFSRAGSEGIGRLCFAPGALGMAALAVYLWVKVGRDLMGR